MMDTSGDKERKTSKSRMESKMRPDEKDDELISIPRKVNVIRNIMSITELKSSKYNKHVYIFGEVHNANFNCFDSHSASEFIIDQLQFLNNSKVREASNFNKTIDFFIEYPLVKSNSSDVDVSSFNITNIFREFKDCFKQDKKNCKTDNIRFHYSDIRQVITEGDIKNTDMILRGIFEIFFYDSTPTELMKNWKNVKKKFIKKYPEEFKNYINTKSELDFIIRGMKMFNGSKLFKNMSSISYQEVKFILQEWIKLMVPKYYKDIKFTHIENFASNAEIFDTEVFNDIYNKILDSIIGYESVYMDVYLLSRMFRKFKLKLGERKEREEPKNIIILVGDLHAEDYIEILKKLGFEIVFRNSNDDGSCLDISKLRQPLFMDKSEYQNIENYNKKKLKAKIEEDYGVSMEDEMF